MNQFYETASTLQSSGFYPLASVLWLLASVLFPFLCKLDHAITVGGTDKMRPRKILAMQIRAGKIGTLKIRSGEISTLEIGTTEGGPAQIGSR